MRNKNSKEVAKHIIFLSLSGIENNRINISFEVHNHHDPDHYAVGFYAIVNGKPDQVVLSNDEPAALTDSVNVAGNQYLP